jgi:TfoX/Sxy family transcriptional regulator of competence genes
MAINELLTDRVREAIGEVPRVKEKRMFRGIAFLVNNKLCMSVGNQELMCRIDPELYDACLEKEGIRALKMRGKAIKGWIYIHEDALKTKRNLQYWLNLALEFNKKAKPSKKKK